MKHLIFIILSLLLSFSLSFGQGNQQKIITVKGPVSVSEMGTTLIHEHIMVDFIGAEETGYHRWNKQEVVDRALPILDEAIKRGVKTLFECTPAYIGRDPLILKELYEKTGMHIITNTGYYGARNNKFIPEHAFRDTPEELARIWIDEFKNGIEETGVYPGFIKIAVDRDETLSPMHQKIVKAATIAHKATGLTIVSHTGPDGPAFAQLAILEQEDVPPDAFVWTHAQHGTLEGHIKAAKMGAWVSLDNVRNRPSNNPDKPGRIEWYVQRLSKLKKEGLLHRILISHDSGWYRVGEPNGGKFNGYTDIFEYLIPALKENGFTDDDINQLLVENPKLAYSIDNSKIAME